MNVETDTFKLIAESNDRDHGFQTSTCSADTAMTSLFHRTVTVTVRCQSLTLNVINAFRSERVSSKRALVASTKRYGRCFGAQRLPNPAASATSYAYYCRFRLLPSHRPPTPHVAKGSSNSPMLKTSAARRRQRRGACTRTPHRRCAVQHRNELLIDKYFPSCHRPRQTVDH